MFTAQGIKEEGRIMDVNKILQLGDKTSQPLKYISSFKRFYKAPVSEAIAALVNLKSANRNLWSKWSLGWRHYLC